MAGHRIHKGNKLYGLRKNFSTLNREYNLAHSSGLTWQANLHATHRKRYIEIARILHKHRLFSIAAQFLNSHGIQKTDERYAQSLAQALEELGPCFIKLGQMMSTRPELLPPPYVAALSRLRAGVTPVPGKTIVSIIEEDFGAPLSQLF